MQSVVRAGRDARTERIGEELLTAAREVFLADGYHGATLDRIAARAGYTKGVVYSRFASKADLFLALLEARIAARADENRAMARGKRGPAGLAQLARRWSELQREDMPWQLLVVEFRIHAARDPELAARYAALHERTLEGLGEIVAEVLGRADATPAGARRARRIAQVLLANGVGTTLEQAVDDSAFPPSLIGALAGAVTEAAS